MSGLLELEPFGLDTVEATPKAVAVPDDYESRAPKGADALLLEEQDKTLPDGLKAEAAIDDESFDVQIEAATGKTRNELMQLITEAEREGRTYVEQYVNPARERSHKAYRNEHFTGSKYLSKRYETRSKLFKPKTRNAVRKAQAAAANALFASADVVTLEAAAASSDQQRASAAIKMELLNYRLERTHGRDSIPWFLVAMGAHQDALIDGVCVSKQYWKFRERTKRDGSTYRVFDRPDVLNFAPENVIFDPNCEWTRPAQTSGYFIARYPMPVYEVMAMMKGTGPGAPKWMEYDEDELLRCSGMAPSDVEAIRGARSGGADAQKAATGRHRVLWVYENFITIDGEDWCFWSIGNQKPLSVPQPTYEAYPAFDGERPFVVGFGALETHRPIPMAPAESWQQLQQEANDLTNLSLDLRKQIVTPVTKVRRGRQVDLEQVLRRGQDTVLMVSDMEDVEFDRPPDGTAQLDVNVLNNDFDELSGTFSQGSVQSNRQLNETVGGMKMLQGGANAITEFDLRVWVETWVEPVLWQLVQLEAHYEDDQKVLTLAAEKANLFETWGIEDVTDLLLLEDVTLTVSAGIGAADPMQGLEKWGVATKLAGEALMPFIEKGLVQVTPDAAAIIDEVYGKAGYKGASERFWKVTPPEEIQPQGEQADPVAMAKVQNDAQRLELDRQKHADEMEIKRASEAREAARAEAEKHFKGAEVQLQVAGHQHTVRKDDRELRLKERAQIVGEQQGQEEMGLRKDESRFNRVHQDREFGHKVQESERSGKHLDREFGQKVVESERAGQHQDREFGQKVKESERAGQHADREHTFKRRESLGNRAHQDREFQHKTKTDDRNHGFEREKFDDSREARQMEDDFRRDEKGVKPASRTARKAEKKADVEATDTKHEQLTGMMKAVLEAVNAPKEITIKRDKNGVSGATVKPAKA